MSAHASIPEVDEDGWITPKCVCGWSFGPTPDDETATDVLMDHAYEAGLAYAAGESTRAALFTDDGESLCSTWDSLTESVAGSGVRRAVVNIDADAFPGRNASVLILVEPTPPAVDDLSPAERIAEHTGRVEFLR